jgi:hypothetical protein
MKPKVAFFTVTGGGEDYEFLLGAIEHHAEMGSHLVLDTTPPDRAIRFTKLPDNVIWIHEPDFGSGWKEFRLRSAVERAMKRAKAFYADVLVLVDSDEFFIKESEDLLFPWAVDAMVEVQCIHWRKDGKPYAFGHSEWHNRLWPSGENVIISENIAWQSHPLYNGNPEHHPVVVPSNGVQMIRVYGHFHHHLHYALGSKALEEETAATTIEGWPDKGTEVASIPWPRKLALWKEKGILPSESFR